MDFPDGFCCFVPLVKRPVECSLLVIACCNQVDVIPVLEWTQVSVALGDGFILDSQMGLLDFPVLEFVGHGEHVLVCAFKLTFSWRY